MSDPRALLAGAEALLVDLDGEVLPLAHGRPSRESAAHLSRAGTDVDAEARPLSV